MIGAPPPLAAGGFWDDSLTIKTLSRRSRKYLATNYDQIFSRRRHTRAQVPWKRCSQSGADQDWHTGYQTGMCAVVSPAKCFGSRDVWYVHITFQHQPDDTRRGMSIT